MLKCSHISCKVNNLAEVVRDYEALGFTMQWGSSPERAMNALLWFEEGPFIEFFQVPKPFTYFSLPLGLIYGRPASQRWKHWCQAAEGWCDLALEPNDDLPTTSEAGKEKGQDLADIKRIVKKMGIATSRVINGQRTRPDGITVKYSLFATKPVGLPFVVSAYDPPQRPLKIKHQNGATGVEWVKVGVAANQLSQFQAISAGDQWLKIEPAPQTQVLEVCLTGLEKKLDSRKAHGAVFTTTNS